MTISFKNLLLLLLLSTLAVACGNAPEGEKVDSADAVETTSADNNGATTYTVDAAASNIEWEGGKKIGDDKHTGTISIQSGELMVANNTLVGGKFVIDMNSLTNSDLEAGNGKEKLEGHLKSDDFFGTGTYPTATFEIASVEPVAGDAEVTHRITGNLMMRDSVRSITIPAKVNMAGDQIMAVTPAFVIDRTQWNVMYGAGVLGLAQDKIIRDEIGLKINLQASAR